MKFDLLAAIRHLDKELGVGKARLEVRTIPLGIEVRIYALHEGNNFAEMFVILSGEMNDHFVSIMGIKFHRAVVSLKRRIGC